MIVWFRIIPGASPGPHCCSAVSGISPDARIDYAPDHHGDRKGAGHLSLTKNPLAEASGFYAPSHRGAPFPEFAPARGIQNPNAKLNLYYMSLIYGCNATATVHRFRTLVSFESAPPSS